MTMYSSCVETLKVVECNRRIDRKAKDTCSEEVPEAHGDEAVDGPLVVL